MRSTITLRSVGVLTISLFLVSAIVKSIYTHSPTSPTHDVYAKDIDLANLYAPSLTKRPGLYVEEIPTPSAVLGTITTIGPNTDTTPVNTTNSIVIPSIDVNNPIALDISVSNKTEYQAALDLGVAHAKGTDKPTTEDSNTYLFAHSTANQAHIARYAAVFTRLDELEIDSDTITLYYNNLRYDYKVVQKEIVPSFETSVLTRNYDYPAVTLQTCYPPGQAVDRLIITGQLIGVYDQ